jgi:hypothetical protein
VNAVFDVLNARTGLDELPDEAPGMSVAYLSGKGHHATLDIHSHIACVDICHLSQAFGDFRADVLVREHDAIGAVMYLRPAFHAPF